VKFEQVAGGELPSGERKAKVIRYNGKAPKKHIVGEDGVRTGEMEGGEDDEEQKHDSDIDIDSDELEDEYFEMTDIQKREYRERRARIKA
jgi:hypothetical protein